MPFLSTKRYGHEQGFSACFRQPKATHSHCSLLHGYALAFTFVFGCTRLDHRNWVMDFGGLKDLKAALVDTFDHKTVIDANDPQLAYFEQGHNLGVLDLRIMSNGVGCERFAELAWTFADKIVRDAFPDGGLWVVSCECAEHEGNSAIYVPLSTSVNRY